MLTHRKVLGNVDKMVATPYGRPGNVWVASCAATLAFPLDSPGDVDPVEEVDELVAEIVQVVGHRGYIQRGGVLMAPSVRAAGVRLPRLGDLAVFVALRLQSCVSMVTVFGSVCGRPGICDRGEKSTEGADVGQTADIERPVVPPMLYVPCEVPQQGADDVSLDFRRMRDGRLALFAYTALDRLVRCCGAQQPWVLMPTAKLDTVAEYQPYDVILLDIDIPENNRVKGRG